MEYLAFACIFPRAFATFSILPAFLHLLSSWLGSIFTVVSASIEPKPTDLLAPSDKHKDLNMATLKGAELANIHKHSSPLKAWVSVLKKYLPLRIVQVVSLWVLVLIVPPGHRALQSLSPLLVLSKHTNLGNICREKCYLQGLDFTGGEFSIEVLFSIVFFSSNGAQEVLNYVRSSVRSES